MAAFAGFDRSAFPGVDTMNVIKKKTNLVWSGFYLGKTPSHGGTDWMGHRADLLAQGWKLVPIYLGQQTIPPGSQHPSGPQGTKDGNDAIRLLGVAGFPAGTAVYLDIEDGSQPTAKVTAYIGTWVDAVAAGGFKPGVYCSHVIANTVHHIRPAARIWAFKVSTNKPHAVAGPPFPTPDPSGSGFAGAQIFQLHQNCQVTIPTVGKLTVDLDSSLTADPSV